MKSLGIDIGSSSVKVSLLDIESGKCLASSTNPSSEMPIKALKNGWAEQDPRMWWQYACDGIRKVGSGHCLSDVKCIGITYQMLENTDRMRSSIARCPKTEYTTAREYFHRLESTLDSTRLPRWEGELYFEYHRGILTSVCEEKRWNRKIEALTHSAEFLAAFAGGEYPAAEFDWIWKKMLLNQFLEKQI